MTNEKIEPEQKVVGMSDIRYSSEEVNVPKRELEPGWKFEKMPDKIFIGMNYDDELLSLLAQDILDYGDNNDK